MDAAPGILEVRGQRVLLDSDLAALHGVTARRLNEQSRRNADRFPACFRESECESRAYRLKTSLMNSLVGVTGFEPATPTSRIFPDIVR